MKRVFDSEGANVSRRDYINQACVLAMHHFAVKLYFSNVAHMRLICAIVDQFLKLDYSSIPMLKIIIIRGGPYVIR
jgi:hypothetical protein